MKYKNIFSALISLLVLLALPLDAQAFDEDAARALARKNDCFLCHGVGKRIDGPSYKSVAEKYRGNKDAEAKLVHHLTAGGMAKFTDGHQEEHKIINTKDVDQIKNLVNWILSL
ncbi:MAG: c-type cytochrome [Gallionellaceae bacterium]|nr:c-type cytochrome [Gallionellaceae bacterium]